MITAEELDRALAAGKVQLTRTNQRPVHCECCGRPCAPGTVVRVFVDGHARGFLGPECRIGMGDDDGTGPAQV